MCVPWGSQGSIKELLGKRTAYAVNVVYNTVFHVQLDWSRTAAGLDSDIVCKMYGASPPATVTAVNFLW